MSNRKVMIIHLIVGLIKKTPHNMSWYFPKLYRKVWGNINVKVDLCNYATKLELKEATGIDTTSFVLKSNLASLKTKGDKLDFDKLIPVPVHSSRLSDVVKIHIVQKTVYDKLVARVNNINISGFVLKTKYDKDQLDIEKKISDAGKKDSWY